MIRSKFAPERILSALLAAVFCLAAIPFSLAANAEEEWRAYSSLETIVLEDEYKNLTEEDLGVLPVGKYKLSIPGVGYVTFGAEGDPLAVSETDQNDLYTLIYQVTGDMPRYTLSPADDVYSVVGTASSSSLTTSGGVVYRNSRKLYTYKDSNSGKYRATEDRSRTMRWYPEPNEDGTYKLALYDLEDPKASNAWRYYAYYDSSDGKIKMKRDTLNLSTDFRLEMVSRSTAQFDQYISYGGRITLRVPKAAKTDAGLTARRAAKWVNDLEKAYWYFNDLTDFIPYENIIVKAYANCTYMAYVTSGYNAITVSYSPEENDFGPQNLWYIQDIRELVQRGEETNDWNFCLMHEMGHMFDMNRGWKFETECLTDFKLAYGLYRSGAAAIPSEFSAEDVFTYDTIDVCYKKLGGDFTKTRTYSFYGAAYKLMLMQKALGWEPIYRAFHWYAENEALPASERTTIPSKNYQKFQLFIDKISEYSGVDVKNTFFSEIDWLVFMNYYGDPDATIPEEPLPDDGAQVIKVFPQYGHIENYSGATYFITGATTPDNAAVFAALKNGTYTMKWTLTDETTGRVYVMNPYVFDAPGAEFYSTSFFRLNSCKYGVEPVYEHEYTVQLDIYEGETRLYTGVSAEGAFTSSQEAFKNDGAIMPAKPKYTAQVICSTHDFANPEFVWAQGLSGAVMTLTCSACGETVETEAELSVSDGVLTASAEFKGVIYIDAKTLLTGDTNGTGAVNLADVTALLNYLTASRSDKEDMVENGDVSRWQLDVNYDGSVDICDVTALLNILAKKGK